MNEVENADNNDIMEKYQKSENILDDIQKIIDVSQKEAYRAVNTILTQRNWLIGYRIAEEEMKGENRAEYGANIIKKTLERIDCKIWKRIYQNKFIQFLYVLQVFSPDFPHSVWKI